MHSTHAQAAARVTHAMPNRLPAAYVREDQGVHEVSYKAKCIMNFGE